MSERGDRGGWRGALELARALRQSPLYEELRRALNDEPSKSSSDQTVQLRRRDDRQIAELTDAVRQLAVTEHSDHQEQMLRDAERRTKEAEERAMRAEKLAEEERELWHAERVEVRRREYWILWLEVVSVLVSVAAIIIALSR
jgi:hypothetical protein